MTASTQQTQLMTFIKSRIPHATVVEIVGTELTVRLPHSESDDEVLYHFFHQLDAQAYQLGVLNYGISNTTLEEVSRRKKMNELLCQKSLNDKYKF